MSGNSNFLSTFAAIRWANWLDQRRREKEREALLNTIALVEEELAKPRYFGFLIEKDRVGYLEALSKTKTTFKGLNPHDPLNGMVVNGELNPDFILMLEKNFFKVNSENLSVDELNFVRYEAERNKMIEWLRGEFQRLSIDDEYLKQEIGITQEKLFQGLLTNFLLFATKIDDERVCVVDAHSYLEGIEKGCYFRLIPQKFCKQERESFFHLDVFNLLESKKFEEERKEQEKREKENLEFKKQLEWFAVIVVIIIFFFIIASIYQ